MARLSNRSRIEQLVDTFEPKVAAAFHAAIDGIKDGVTLRVLAERLERGDVYGAIEALNLDRAAYGPLDIALAEAFNAGGMDTVDGLPILRDPQGHRVLVRWDVRNPVAETWLRNHSSSLITHLIDDQREAVRAALSEGLVAGRNPRSVALDIVGRIDRVSGKRSGGLVGLASPQAAAVAKSRSELTSNDPATLRAYLQRGRRDRRFDKSVEKAIREGRALDSLTISRMVGRYSDSLLQLRGETIAQLETMTALAGAKNEAMRQAIADGKIDVEAVTKVWKHSYAEHPRVQHLAINGKSVGFNEDFVLPDGTRMSFPHDPRGGARHNAGCRCLYDVKIDHLAAVVRRAA